MRPKIVVFVPFDHAGIGEFSSQSKVSICGIINPSIIHWELLRKSPILCTFTRMLVLQLLLVDFGLVIHLAYSVSALFVSPVTILVPNRSQKSINMSSQPDSDASEMSPCPHPFLELPGDPSLLLVTNVDLGGKKLDIMKQCSKAICEATGKPEAYIGVSITDNASVIFGGSDAPCALGNMYSIGAIAMESNGKIQAAVTDLLEPFGVAEDRMYINFFDMPRANVGWSRRTFAG